MRTKDLVLRCYAVQKKGAWEVFCLDFSLAAQADTLQEAKAKLEEMIKEYVFDALIGEDKEYADQLLHRSAPFSEWLKYYVALAKCRFPHIKDNLQCFLEPLPLTPYNGRA